MKNLFTIFLVLNFFQVKSQVPTWEWATAPSTGQSSLALADVWCSDADGEGNNYIGGVYRDTLIFGLDTLTENKGLTAFFAKYNSSGNIVWAKSAAGDGYSWANGVASEKNGNSYFGGYFNSASISFDTLVLSQIGGHDMFLLKYDPLGNIIWAKSFGDVGGNVDLMSVATDALGNVFATGYFSTQTIAFDTFQLENSDPSQLTTDFFLVKFDSDGIVLWAESGIGTGVEYGMGVSTDANNNVYLTGLFSSSNLIIGFDTLTNHDSNSTTDVFLIKYDTYGNSLWARCAGGTSAEQPFSITVNALGDAFITGYFYSSSIIFGTDTLISIALNNVFLFKFDSDGNESWAISQNSGSGVGRCVHVEPCGNIFLVGTSLSESIGFDSILLTVDTVNFDDMFIVEFNSSGDVVWGEAFSFGGDDVISIASDAFDNAYLAGDFASPTIIIADDTLVNTEEETPFVAKLSFKCSTGVTEIPNNLEITLFPNPFIDELNVNVKDLDLLEIIFYDLVGRKLLQQTFINAATLKISNLPNGLYIYELRNKNKVISQGKIVKQ